MDSAFIALYTWMFRWNDYWTYNFGSKCNQALREKLNKYRTYNG